VVGNTNGGGDYQVSIALVNGGISQMQRSQIFTDASSGDLARGDTRLEDIAQFFNEDGISSVSSPQKLTISGNSESVEITVDGKMTLDQLAAALQQALSGSSGLGIDNSSSGVVSTAQTGVSGMGGYLELVSGSAGDRGDFSIAGPQDLIDSLGLSVVRESVNSLVDVTLKDAQGNSRTTRTSSDRAYGLLNGIDVQFQSQAAQIAGSGGIESGLRISVAGGLDFTLDAGGGSVDITIATGNWTMEGIARSINQQIEDEIAAAAGGADEALLGLSASVVDGEIRLSYEPQLVSVTSSIIDVSAAAPDNALGMVDGSYSGFVDASKDSDFVIQGLGTYRDDVANGTAVTFTLTDGDGDASVLNSYATTDDPEVADMKEIKEFLASANATFDADDVQIRADMVNGSLAFTATRVGQENQNGGAPVASRVTLAVNQGFAETQFGLKNGTKYGSGDTNFRLHVVDNKPQFQIGADPGQNMQVSMGNMSSNALGVDNLDMTTVKGAQEALVRINKGLDMISAERSKLGAFQNRLEYAINNIRNTSSNLTSAEARIRDADIAMEMIEFTRNQIVAQSGTAMLAQANMLPQSVLSLLGQ
jgi:flagellin-like hook-associated protein FlgL